MSPYPTTLLTYLPQDRQVSVDFNTVRALALPTELNRADATPFTEDFAQAVRPYVLPLVWARETAGQGLFATDLRPATALFVRFKGLDYDHDPAARRH